MFLRLSKPSASLNFPTIRNFKISRVIDLEPITNREFGTGAKLLVSPERKLKIKIGKIRTSHKVINGKQHGC